MCALQNFFFCTGESFRNVGQKYQTNLSPDVEYVFCLVMGEIADLVCT